MEQVLRIIVEGIIRMFAWIPLGAFSLAFIVSLKVVIQSVTLWVQKGIWHVPRLFETFNMDFLSLLMDEKVSGFRLPLIQFAAKTAALPTPVFLLITGIVCLGSGLALLHFANAIKTAGGR